MGKRVLAILAVVAMAGSLSLLSAAGTKGTWTGIVTDKMCATKGVNLTDAACAAKCVAAGDKWALYNSADKKVYTLTGSEKIAAQAGKTVTISGSADGDTITVASIKPAKAS
jgi:hypothetical protein